MVSSIYNTTVANKLRSVQARPKRTRKLTLLTDSGYPAGQLFSWNLAVAQNKLGDLKEGILARMLAIIGYPTHVTASTDLRAAIGGQLAKRRLRVVPSGY